MSKSVGFWDSGGIARRWCGLAERRRAYLGELYRTGRWRHYYSEQEFLACVRQAAADIDAWDALAGSEVPVLKKAS